MCEQAKPNNGKIPTGYTRDWSLYFYFGKLIFKNVTVIHTYVNEQSNTNKERETIYSGRLKASSCIYTTNTIFHSIHNLELSVLPLLCMKNASDSLPLMYFKMFLKFGNHWFVEKKY